VQYLRVLAGALALALVSGLAGAQVDEDSTLPKVEVMSCGSQCANFVQAKEIQADYPKFPRSVDGPLNPHAEGWAWLRYIIGKDGKPRDAVPIYVLGPQGFADQAAQAMKSWRYEPAKLNGAPVEVIGKYTFFYHATARVAGQQLKVEDLYKEAVELDKAGKMEEIRPRLEEAFNLPYLSFYERNYLAFPLAQLAIKRKDYYEARRLALLGTMISVPMPLVVQAGLWQIRISTDLYLGEMGDALTAATYLAEQRGIDQNLPLFKITDDTRARLDAMPLQTAHGIIPHGPESSVYWHYLNRRTFGFHVTSGSLDKFFLGCRANMIESKITETAQWRIPKSWDDCMIAVYGAPGAKFDLIEASDDPTAATPVEAKYDADIRANPDSAIAYLARGRAYQERKMRSEAFADFDKAVALDPKMMDAYRARYQLAFDAGDFAAAEANGNSAVAVLAKDDTRGYLMRGWARRGAGKYNEALADFDKVIALSDKNPDPYMARAVTLFCLERYIDAQVAIGNYLRLGGYRPLATNWLHVIEMKRGVTSDPAKLTHVPNIGWSSRIIALYRGEKTVAEIEGDIAAAATPLQKEYWSCEAKFFLAEYKLEKGDIAGAKAGLAALSPASCATAAGVAMAELKRLPAR
jgi:lipoprotein NlpI